MSDKSTASTKYEVRSNAGFSNVVLQTSYLRSPAFLLALVFFAFHLPYLPTSLEDLDSINFALGVRFFDVAQHQPHPPGYPIYILLGKLLHAAGLSETSALALLAVAGGALLAIAIGALFRRVDESDATWWPEAATIVAVTSPLCWFTAVRPLSDMPGLAAAVAVQAMTLAARTPRMLYATAFCAALATGIRSQVAWLTVPLLAFVALGRSTAVAPALRSRARTMAGVAVALLAGALLWFVPLVMLTGGPVAYWRALSFQGSADIGNIQMLWTRHGARDVLDAMYYACIAPWANWRTAAVVWSFVVIGTVALLIRRPRVLAPLAAAFGPYLVFDLLFQETFTTRYALPLVIPTAYLAVAGMRLLPWRSGAVVAAAVAMFDAHVGGTSVAAYASQKAPAFRLLDAMRGAANATREPPVLAMDRKQSFDFRRPIVWAGGEMPRVASTLPVPPQHEWLEAVKYWSGGGRAPVWFVVDPKRTMIDLVQHDVPSEFRWPLPYPVLIGGARPDEMDFYRVEAPEWFVGEGWALTPEAGGIAETDHRGLAFGPIEAWVSTRVLGGEMIIGGRNFSSSPTTISLEEPTGFGAWMQKFDAPPGPFLRAFPVSNVEPPRPPGYFKLVVRASPPTPAAIEQFDAASALGGRRPLFGFGPGWHEQEFNPRTGQRWRWLSERGELRFASPTARLRLHIEAESPLVYFSRGSRLVARAADRVVFDRVLSSDFKLDIPIPDGVQVVTLETDQVYQPADRSRRSADRRHLGLRIFKCELRPAS